MNTQKIASFTIPKQLILETPDLVRNVLAGLIVVEARFDWALDAFKYTALGEQFPEIPMFTSAPEFGLQKVFRKDGRVTKLLHLSIVPGGDKTIYE